MKPRLRAECRRAVSSDELPISSSSFLLLAAAFISATRDCRSCEIYSLDAVSSAPPEHMLMEFRQRLASVQTLETCSILSYN